MLGSNSGRCFGLVFFQIDICEMIWQLCCYCSLSQLKAHNFYLFSARAWLSLFAVHLQNRFLLFLVSLVPFEGAAQKLRLEGGSEPSVSQTSQEVHCIYVHFLAPVTALCHHLVVKVWHVWFFFFLNKVVFLSCSIRC